MKALYRQFAIVTMGISLAAGCGTQELEGTWVTREVKPAEGQKHYNLAKVTFNKDKTFESVAIKAGQKTISKGKYTYDLWRKQLTLQAEGKELKYGACIWWGNELRIEKKIPDSTKVTAYLERPKKTKRCPKCGTPIK